MTGGRRRAIVVPDDYPPVLTGTPAETQLRALGPDIRIFTERGADDEGELIRRVGDDNVVISTDYPHADSHWPNAVNDFMAVEIPSDARKKILWDNCARLYGGNRAESFPRLRLLDRQRATPGSN